MDGVLVLNKPEGYSSHDIAAILRKVFGTKKIGHTGTLDPIATGVLVMCINKATRLEQYLQCEDKIYEVEMKFGVKTDTGDRTGKVIKRSRKKIDEDKLGEVLGEFIGKQKQIPPMYSAIKVRGKKLYEYAREGKTIRREPRDIEIYDIDEAYYDEGILRFRIHCSKGTYIRTVCEDIAEKMGSVGTMMELHRVQSGMFTIHDAVSLDDVSEEAIISIDNLFENELVLKKDCLFKLLNGVALYHNKPDGIYNLYIDNYYSKKYIGVGKIKDKYLKREVIL